MLKKEINEVSRYCLYLVVFVVVLPPLFLIGTRLWAEPIAYGELLFPIFQLGMLIFALLMGLSMFLGERGQDAVEYLLTLPLSRQKLLAVKLLPRFLALLPFTALYLLLLYLFTGSQGSDGLLYALPTPMFLYAMTGLFVVSVSFSAIRQNFLFLAFLSLAVFALHSLLFYKFFYTVMPLWFNGYLSYQSATPVAIGVLSLLLPLLIAFFLSFKKFDVSAGRVYHRIFSRRFWPLFIAGFALSFLYVYSIRDTFHNYYYLTKDHKLLEIGENSGRIYDGDGAAELADLEMGWVVQEEGDYVYLSPYYPRNRIVRYNTKTAERVVLYEGREKARFLFFPRMFENRIAAISLKRDWKTMTLVSVNLDTAAAAEIPLPTLETGTILSPLVFAADRIDGKLFWLIYSGDSPRRMVVRRVWEDGRVEKIADSTGKPAYVNRMLVTGSREGLVFSRISADGTEPVTVIPEGKRYQPIRDWRGKLDNAPADEIYVAMPESSRLLHIDLKTMSAAKIEAPGLNVYYFAPDDYYCSVMELDKEKDRFYLTSISQLKDGKVRLIKEFTDRRAYSTFSFSKWGVVVEQDGQKKVFTLPGFREVTFKGLN